MQEICQNAFYAFAFDRIGMQTVWDSGYQVLWDAKILNKALWKFYIST